MISPNLFGLIQAEDAKSFIDLSLSNVGNDKLYRADNLDVYLDSQKTTRYVGSILAGERLDYSVKAPSSGKYQVEFLVATNLIGAKSFDVFVKGVYQSTVTFERSSSDLGWEKFQPVSTSVNLSGNIEDISIVAKTSGFNIDSFKLTGPLTATSNLFGLIQAEDAKSFIDLSLSNVGNDKLYRADNLDVYLDSQKTTRYVGSILAGERLDYSVKAPSSGKYQVEFLVATNLIGAKSFDVFVKGVYQSTVTFERSSSDLGWEKFQPVSTSVNLSGNIEDISIVAKTSGFNIDSFKLTGPLTATSNLFGLIQAEDAKSFIDLSLSNVGNDKLYRADNLDVYLDSQKTTRYVGSILAGERLDYSVKAPSSGKYQVEFLVATNLIGAKSFDVFVKGVYQSTVTFERSSSDLGWEKFQPVSTSVNLSGNIEDISIVAKTSGFNIDSLKLTGPLTSTSSPQTIIIDNDFDNSPLGTYTLETVNAEWNKPAWTIGIKEGRAKIVGGAAAYKGQALEVRMPAGKIGTASGVHWETDLGGNYNEVVMSYYVKFASNFRFDLAKNGGKALGLAGGDGAGGGKPATGFNGWSSRLVWNNGGLPRQYVYHVDQPTNYGDSTSYQGFNFKPGTWHKIETRIVMNTPGQNNGIIQGSFDGVLAMDRRDYNFRETDDFAIDSLFFKTFMGGNTTEWAPLTDTSISFDEIVVKAVPNAPAAVSAAVSAPDPITGGTSLLTYEAEDLDTITNFRVEQVAAASKRSVLSLVGGTTDEIGKATLLFGDDPTEATGEYRLSLRYFDENDGTGQIRVLLSDAETASTRLLGSFNLDRPSGSNSPGTATLFTYDLPASVLLTPGDKIVIEGYENLSEHVRIDQLLLRSV